MHPDHIKTETCISESMPGYGLYVCACHIYVCVCKYLHLCVCVSYVYICVGVNEQTRHITFYKVDIDMHRHMSVV